MVCPTEAILEGLANELRRIVEEREAKSVPASQQELDELDLKLRSLRTQLRKAEENSNLLAKQKKELEEKIKKNTNDVSCFQLCSILCILVFCIGTAELNLVSFLLVRLSTEHIAVQSINVDKTFEVIYP